MDRKELNEYLEITDKEIKNDYDEKRRKELRNYNPADEYTVKDGKGNIVNIAPCYAEEEDSMVTAVKAYEAREKKNTEEDYEQIDNYYMTEGDELAM